MGPFNYFDYCIGLTIGCRYPKKFGIIDNQGEIVDSIASTQAFTEIIFGQKPLAVLRKGIAEIVIDIDNFILNFRYFMPEKLESRLPKDKLSLSIISEQRPLDVGPFIKTEKNIEQIKSDFTEIFNLTFGRYLKAANIVEIDRIGFVYYFVIPYREIKITYIENLFKGADIGFAENIEKKARNVYKYNITDNSYNYGILDFNFPNFDLSPISKDIGMLTIDVQTYFHVPKSITNFGGVKNIVLNQIREADSFIERDIFKEVGAV